MKPPNKKCLECGKPFYRPPCLARIKYCCDLCYRKSRKGKKYEDLVGIEKAKQWKDKVSVGTKNNLPSTAIKKGQRLSPITEFKKGENIGEEHHSWKGDDVGYGGLHSWVRRHKPIPKTCPICNEEKNKHAHNISGLYKRDITDWVYMCHHCHMTLHRKIREKEKIKKCYWCKKEFITYKNNQKFCSISCGLMNRHKKIKWSKQK